MKEIGVSTDVFARIWSLRHEGEESEDVILRRVLWDIGNPGLPKTRSGSQNGGRSGLPAQIASQESGGIVDRRYGVHFPEGFEIERTYLGRQYRAVVRNRRWVVDGIHGEFSRLNELSRAIGTKTENAWANWYFADQIGLRRPVSDLRPPESISSRSTSVAKPQRISQVARSTRVNGPEKPGKVRWCDDVKTALEELGGRASLHSIYKRVAQMRHSAGRSVPPSLEATVRRTLEDFSADSENFRGEDWFEMVEGKGGGVWGLRSK